MSLPFLFVAALYFHWFQPVEIVVRPVFSHAPATFQATVFIERHPNNRLLVIAYDGPEYKSTRYELAGDRSSRAFQPRGWTLRSVGDYVATATVTRMVEGREQTLIARAPFRVIGFEP